MFARLGCKEGGIVSPGTQRGEETWVKEAQARDETRGAGLLLRWRARAELERGVHRWIIITFVVFPPILSCTPPGIQVSLTS